MSFDVFGDENKRKTIERFSQLRHFKFLSKPNKVSAVLIPLCFYQNIPSVLFLKRPMSLRVHAGEISFPGGQCDHTDDGNLVRTALRETEEEIGLSPNHIDIWSVLPRVDAKFSVYPVVGFCGHISPLSFQNKCMNSLNRNNTTMITENCENSCHNYYPDSHILKLNPPEVCEIFIRSIDWLIQSINLNFTKFRVYPSYSFHTINNSNFDETTNINIKKYGKYFEKFIYTTPCYGGFSNHMNWSFNSVYPRIWGLTAFIIYRFLYCLIPPEMQTNNEINKNLKYLI